MVNTATDFMRTLSYMFTIADVVMVRVFQVNCV
jgi:hypothetical protein